jgi:hypothetical protein
MGFSYPTKFRQDACRRMLADEPAEELCTLGSCDEFIGALGICHPATDDSCPVFIEVQAAYAGEDGDGRQGVEARCTICSERDADGLGHTLHPLDIGQASNGSRSTRGVTGARVVRESHDRQVGRVRAGEEC